jgi:large subunit ribosomal protein L7/L12
MASEKIAALIEEVKALTVIELSELVHALEEEFGVSAASMAAPAAGAAGGGAEAAAEEQTEFDVVMTDFGANKIGVIKEVRAIVSGLSLADAKALVEGVPAKIREAVGKDEAAEVKSKLEAAGATVEIK